MNPLALDPTIRLAFHARSIARRMRAMPIIVPSRIAPPTGASPLEVSLNPPYPSLLRAA